MLKIAICEDEKVYAEDMERCIQAWAVNNGLNIKIRKFNNGRPLLECIAVNGTFDLIFMDVEMNKMGGLETAAKIRETDSITAIIFVSQYETYYREAYNVHPFHFLQKPINSKKLEETMDSFVQMKGQDIEVFTFIVNKAQFNIRLNDIMYFYSENRQVIVVCEDETYAFYGKLNDVQEQLAKRTKRFLRIHQSFLVNMKYVKEYHYTELLLYNGEALYISKDNRRKMHEIHMLLMEI